MEGSVEVVVAELHAAAERLRDAGQRLQDGLSGVDLETRQLLGSGWKGGAASAYAPAWDQWHTGAGQVVRGLQTMADLLNLSGKEYAKTDQQSGDALNATMQTGGGGAPAGGGGGGTLAAAAPTSEPLTGLAQMMDLEQLGSVAESAQSAPQQLGGFLQQGAQMAGGFVEQVSSMVEGAAAGGDSQGEKAPNPEPQSETDRDAKHKDEP